MKRLTSGFLALVFAMGLPMTVAAMSHGDHSGHGKQKAEEMKQHGDMQHADQGQHKGHDTSGQDDGFVEIGKDTKDGVVATVKVKAYDEETRSKMSAMGMAASHHIMAFFVDEKTGAEIVDGTVALKIKGQEDKPVKLMQMGTGFGSDVSLEEGTMYTFEIGTRFADNDKRQFEVGFHNH